MLSKEENERLTQVGPGTPVSPRGPGDPATPVVPGGPGTNAARTIATAARATATTLKPLLTPPDAGSAGVGPPPSCDAMARGRAKAAKKLSGSLGFAGTYRRKRPFRVLSQVPFYRHTTQNQS